jgi:hypothetical protein
MRWVAEAVRRYYLTASAMVLSLVAGVLAPVAVRELNFLEG